MLTWHMMLAWIMLNGIPAHAPAQHDLQHSFGCLRRTALPLFQQVAGPLLRALRGMSSLLVESECAAFLMQVRARKFAAAACSSDAPGPAAGVPMSCAAALARGLQFVLSDTNVAIMLCNHPITGLHVAVHIVLLLLLPLHPCIFPGGAAILHLQQSSSVWPRGRCRKPPGPSCAERPRSSVSHAAAARFVSRYQHACAKVIAGLRSKHLTMHTACMAINKQPKHQFAGKTHTL